MVFNNETDCLVIIERYIFFSKQYSFENFCGAWLKVFNTRLGKELHFYSRALFTEKELTLERDYA